jgi:hypothetical protein
VFEHVPLPIGNGNKCSCGALRCRVCGACAVRCACPGSSPKLTRTEIATALLDRVEAALGGPLPYAFRVEASEGGAKVTGPA